MVCRTDAIAEYDFSPEEVEYSKPLRELAEKRRQTEKER